MEDSNLLGYIDTDFKIKVKWKHFSQKVVRILYHNVNVIMFR